MRLYKCEICLKEFNKRNKIKRISKKNYCIECYKKKRKEKRKVLFDKEIKKEDASRSKVKFTSWKKPEKKLKQKNQELPLIKKIKPKIKGLYLTLNEKQFLFRTYIKNGLTPEEANKKIKDLIKSLKDLVNKLKEKRKSEEQIRKKFKEEFMKLCKNEHK